MKTFDNLIHNYYFYNYLQVSSTESSTLVSSTYNIPLTAVGDASEIHNNLLNSSSSYADVLSSSDAITNSPFNGESSTLGAFFMSEMERLSTVKSITGLNFE